MKSVNADNLDEVGEVLQYADADLVQIIEEHVKHRQKITTGNVLADDQRQLVNRVCQRPTNLPLSVSTHTTAENAPMKLVIIYTLARFLSNYPSCLRSYSRHPSRKKFGGISVKK